MVLIAQVDTAKLSLRALESLESRNLKRGEAKNIITRDHRENIQPRAEAILNVINLRCHDEVLATKHKLEI